VRIVPSLEGLLSAALEREALLAGVVETAALRRADVVKTALLRTVSHDLRTPLTAIATAGEALRSASLSADERAEMAGVVSSETERLSRLVDNLLDLSRLQAGAATPRIAWASIDEVIGTALLDMGARPEEFSVSVGAELPLVRADPAQLERAFVNVLENARRHSNGHPVSVRARTVHGLVDGPERERLVVRVVDRGPGIAPADLERVFEPFYRAGDGGDHSGSGLGLAIARGLTEANGGHLHVESLPGQGSSFVFELPVPAVDPDEAEASQ
jgi:two-component system sensor histidine kinase KdpD